MTMFKKIAGTVAVGICAISLYYGAAFSTPPSGQTPIGPELRGTFDELHVKHNGDAKVTVKSREDVDVVTTQATLAIGGYTGWHSHPGPVLVTVIQGTLTVYNAPKCRPRVYHAGEGFVEKSPVVHVVRNEGTEEAKFTATFIIPVAAARRTDEPQPTEGNCPIL
jgi:quercetin dioxygenase-like cupin family protein